MHKAIDYHNKLLLESNHPDFLNFCISFLFLSWDFYFFIIVVIVNFFLPLLKQD